MKNFKHAGTATGRFKKETKYVSTAPIPEKETTSLSTGQEAEILLEDFADQYWAAMG
jgi:hypothetical protein